MTVRFEKLSTAHDAYVRAVIAADNGGFAEAQALVRAENVLFDACLDCGMNFENPSPVEWAAQHIAEELMRSAQWDWAA